MSDFLNCDLVQWKILIWSTKTLPDGLNPGVWSRVIKVSTIFFRFTTSLLDTREIK